MSFAGAIRAEVVIDGKTETSGAAWAPANAASDKPASQPLFTATRGRTVMMGLDNRTDSPNAFHVHGHAFRLLDRLDDGWKPFWLDTVVVPPRQILRIAFVADNPGKWLIHRYAIGRSQSGTAAWFAVT